MIKDELIEVRISNKTLSYYKCILNTELSVGDIIEIKSSLIPSGSSIKIIAICDFCGNEKLISMKEYNRQIKGGISCGKTCSILKSKKTCLYKYGVENVFQSESIKNRIKSNFIELYGVENPNQVYAFQEKRKDTNRNRYGCDYPSSNDFIKSKVKNTNMIKFGCDYPSQNSDIKDKMKLHMIEKYGVDNFSRTNQFKIVIKDAAFKRMFDKLSASGILKSSIDGRYRISCKSCDSDFEILSSLMNKRLINDEILCLNCNPLGKKYKQEEINEFIHSSIDYIVISNDRKILNGKEIDIYIPELKLGFEFNGLYWHSELFRSPTSHIDKTKSCNDQGISLFHIWEDDWLYKQDIVKSMILNKLGKTPNKMFARKCIVKLVDNKLVRNFLENNHIQGFVGSKIKLGLFYNDELVSLMTFGNLRKSLGQKSQEGSYELLRFCNKLNTTVVGGASKLFKYFLNNYDIQEVISYSDLSRSNGNMYKQLGFTHQHNSDPNYYYIVDGIRNHRFNFRKDKLVKEGADPTKTEIQIMNERGFYRIFDCGMQKWKLVKN